MSDSSIEDPLKIYESQSSVNSHLKMVVISRPEIRSLCIYTNDGKVFYQDDNTRAPVSATYSLTRKCWTGKEGEREAQSVHNV